MDLRTSLGPLNTRSASLLITLMALNSFKRKVFAINQLGAYGGCGREETEVIPLAEGGMGCFVLLVLSYKVVGSSSENIF